MSAIEVCRTAALGGHLEQCDQCFITSAPATTLAATVIAQSVSLWLAPSGSRNENPKFLETQYFHVVFTSRKRLPPLLTRTRKWSTTCCSEPLRRPCAPSPPTPNIWAPRSASSPYFTPGGRTCFFILICIASFPAADFHRTATRWISCRPGFFLPVRVLSRLFRRLFLELSAGGLRRRQAALLTLCFSTPRSRGFHPLSRPSAQRGMGRLRQATFRRATASGGLCRPLHPPGRHFQQSSLDIEDGQVKFRYIGLPRRQ